MIRKNLLRKLLVLCVSSLGLTSMVSCGKEVDDPTVLTIHINRKGNGDKFVYALADKFTEIYGNKVDIKSTPLDDLTRTKLKSGANNNNVDLFMAVDEMFDLIAMGKNALIGYDSIFTDLTDVYEDYGYNSNIKIKDFIDKDAYDYYTTDNKQWIIPYIQNCTGIVYNKALFDKVGIKQVPRTTNELIETCEKLKNAGITSFIYPGKYDYWKNVYSVWWAQYEGMDNINLFLERKDSNGMYSVDCYKQPGRLYCLEVLEELLKPSNGYADRNANTYEFTQAQVKYLEGEGAMMPNGDWLENEMNENFGDEKLEIKFMKTPIISKLGTKLNISEEELISIIDYVDGTTSTKPNLADEIINTVKEARTYVVGGTNAAQAFIPVYSNAIELAKNFLKLMYSPTGAEIFFESTKGLTLPVKYDYKNSPTYSKISYFQQGKIDYIKDAKFFAITSKKYPMVYAGNTAAFFVDSGCLEKNLGTNSVNDLKTAKELYQYDINYYQARWDSIMSQAGVSND